AGRRESHDPEGDPRRKAQGTQEGDGGRQGRLQRGDGEGRQRVRSPRRSRRYGHEARGGRRGGRGLRRQAGGGGWYLDGDTGLLPVRESERPSRRSVWW